MTQLLWKYPVPAVRLILTDTQGRVLLVRRSNCDNATGYWCLPGGKIDYNCSIEQSIRQELQEETALQLDSYRFLFYQESPPFQPGAMHCLNLYFECRAHGQVALNEESSEFAWVHAEDLSHYRIAFRNDLGLQQYFQANVA